MGGPVVGATAAALSAGFGGSPADGSIGVLRPAGGSDRKMMIYDSTLGKWVGDTERWCPGSADASGNAASDAWNFQLQRNGNTNGTMMHGPIMPWRVWDGAGIQPQFRFLYQLFNNLNPTNGRTYIRRWASGYNVGDLIDPNGGARLGNADALDGAISTTYEPGANNVFMQGDIASGTWRDITATHLADVRDVILPILGLYSNVSPSISTGRVYDLTVMFRWVSK